MGKVKIGLVLVAAGLFTYLSTGPASAAGPDDATKASPVSDAPVEARSAPSDVSDPQPAESDGTEFSALVERHAKVVMFVRRLAAEQEAFEQAVDQYLKTSRFLKRLEAERAAREERWLDAEVSRFMRVRTFLKDLESPRPSR